MANSYQEYTSGLTGTSFTGFNVKFINQGHLKVATSTNNGTTYTTGALTVTVSGTTATTNSAPSTGSDGINKIRIYRSTGTAELVDFQSGSRITESDLDTSYRHAVYAAQEVQENASGTGYPSTGAAGAAGVGITTITADPNAAGTGTTVTIQAPDSIGGNKTFDVLNGTNGVLQKNFESAETAIPASQTELEFNHNFGVVPKIFQWVLICKSAENGYAVGDEINVLTNSRPAANISVFANATKCVFSYTTSLEYALKGSSGEWSCSNAQTNWKLICRAFA
mgnify:CR=1 FL=1